MDDLREKVIDCIGRCLCHVPDACRDCAYDAGHPYNECVELLLKDALALLKEQQSAYERGKRDGVSQYLRDREEDEEYEY